MNKNRREGGKPGGGGRGYRCQRCGEDGTRGPRHSSAICKAIPPLWWRAWLARLAPRGPFWGKPRTHERAKVGDVFGPVTVVQLMRPDYTSNERVLVRCTCGIEAAAYVFNLRKRTGGKCRHSAWAIEAFGAQPSSSAKTASR